MNARITMAASMSALLIALGGAAQAQTAASSGASLEIRDGVQISTLQRMTFRSSGVEAVAPSATSLIDATAVIQVSGDPGRTYRIRMPRFVEADGRAVVEAMTAHSQSGGDLSADQGGAISTDGRDVVSLRGQVRLSTDVKGETAAMPLSVDVE